MSVRLGLELYSGAGEEGRIGGGSRSKSVLGANGGRLLAVLTGLAKSGEAVCARLYGGRSDALSLDRRRLGQFSTASENDEGGEGREKLRECVRERENRLERRSPIILKLLRSLPEIE